MSRSVLMHPIKNLFSACFIAVVAVGIIVGGDKHYA